MQYLDFNLANTIENSLQKLNNYTALTFLSPGSKARNLIQILGEELGEEAVRFDANVGSALIRNASGKILDYIGEIYNLERLPEVKASIASEEENFVLYTLENNFGDINNGQDIIIPESSLQIYSTEEDSPSRITYTNTERIILKAGENNFYFAAEAVTGGESSNIGERSLNFHNFINYAGNLDRSLLVTNTQSIIYGRDRETDDNYRYRIQYEKISNEKGNDTAIRLACLTIPGVADVTKINFPRGIGTADWLIRSTSPTISFNLLEQIQVAIEEVESSGTHNLAKSPLIIGLELSFSLTYKRNLRDEEKESIKNLVISNISSYVNNLAIGEKLVLDQIVRVVLSSHNDIESMGDIDSVDNFNSIYIYKRSETSNSITRKRIVKDYISRSYERVILEPTLEIPVDISDNN